VRSDSPATLSIPPQGSIAEYKPPFPISTRRQLFICVHNETLSVVAMRVSNPDCSPALRDAFSVFAPDINTNRSVGRL
jgi:hypothetical protein